MRTFPFPFAAALLAILLPLAAHAASFTPAHGQYVGHLHGSTIIFHFGAQGVTNCTYDSHTVHHGTYHTGDHSFYFTINTTTAIQGQWTQGNTAHCQLVMHREKQSFTAHLQH